jgi:hypothetical protein
MPLLYSARPKGDLLFRRELEGAEQGMDVRYTLTRSQPQGWTGYRRRVARAMLEESPGPSRPITGRSSAGRRRSSSMWQSCSSRLDSSPQQLEPSDSDRQEAEMDELRLDGNSAAGLLQEVLPFEMTTTSSRCHGCGAIEALSALLSYGGAGRVLRCPHCESVVLRVVHSDGRYWLDLRGAGYLELRRT